MKDQTKKVSNLKHKEQVEKNKNAQLMEEARKLEDNMNESSQQIKVKSTWHLFTLFTVMYSSWVCSLARYVVA